MSELMASGLQLMLVGMGTVFFFLTSLVFATMLMSNLVQRFVPVMQAPNASDDAMVDTKAATKEEEIAAITAAIQMHRQKR